LTPSIKHKKANQSKQRKKKALTGTLLILKRASGDWTGASILLSTGSGEVGTSIEFLEAGGLADKEGDSKPRMSLKLEMEVEGSVVSFRYLVKYLFFVDWSI
jgi:hypothetical protein